MAGKDIIVMTQKELRRLHVIHKLLNKNLKQVEAADILGLSTRQVRRITKRVKEEADKGIIHKLHRKPSGKATPKENKR